jgi:hypothetical protein
MRNLTVKDLAKQLQMMVENGYGDSPIVYLDTDDISHKFDTGVHDIWRNGENTTVVLG